MSTPHPDLAILLAKFDLDWSTFRKRGRPPIGVREKRSAIVTELHEKGLTWAEIQDVTGLSNGSIQRLSKAKGCDSVIARREALGKVVGASWKGRPRHGQLKYQWAKGDFECLRGRARSPEEREALRQGWTPEARQRASENSLKLWSDQDIRARLLHFHRSPEERARRSREQVDRMQKNSGVFLRGRAQWVNTPKGNKDQVRVRSSYEAAAVRILEADPDVVEYEFERRVVLPDNKLILPDFIVTFMNKSLALIEVKASWVLGLGSEHPVIGRLCKSEEYATRQGWGFSVWTEKELGIDL